MHGSYVGKKKVQTAYYYLIKIHNNKHNIRILDYESSIDAVSFYYCIHDIIVCFNFNTS